MVIKILELLRVVLNLIAAGIAVIVLFLKNG